MLLGRWCRAGKSHATDPVQFSCPCSQSLVNCVTVASGHVQVALVGLAAFQIKTGASPWDRARLFPIFFLGSAELASGLSGL